MISPHDAPAATRRRVREELSAAEKPWFDRLSQYPGDVEALNVVAMSVLRRGEVLRALSLLSHAQQVNPDDAITHHHLGRVRETMGEFDLAIDAYRRATRLRPGFHVARLHLAAALERRGDSHAALLHYARTLAGAQSSGVWIDAASTPIGARPLVEHAVDVVRRHRRELCDRWLAELASRHGHSELRRVELCLEGYLRGDRAQTSDARQRPTFLYFPDLPTTPWFARDLCPWTEALEAATPDIRGELLAVLASDAGRERVFGSDALEAENLRSDASIPTWNGYYFHRHGEARDDNRSRCPRTSAALDALPLPHIRDHAPEVLFSVFTPDTHLLPHCGVTNTRVVGHLPLVVPADCALRVGGEIHAWQEGRVVVFDDTFEHEAWNRGSSLRVVLIFDLWNPWLTAAERDAVRLIVESTGDFRASLDAL